MPDQGSRGTTTLGHVERQGGHSECSKNDEVYAGLRCVVSVKDGQEKKKKRFGNAKLVVHAVMSSKMKMPRCVDAGVSMRNSLAECQYQTDCTCLQLVY